MKTIKSFFVFLLISALCLGGLSFYFKNYYIPQKIEENILWAISDLGFENLKIGHIKNQNGVLSFNDISLDHGKFSTVERVEFHFGLIDYFLKNKKLSKISIHNMNLTGTVSQNFDFSFSGFSSVSFADQIRRLNAGLILIKDSQAHLISDVFGGVSMSYSAQINYDSEINFIGNIQTEQKKLEFDAKFSGNVISDNSITVDLEAESLSLKSESSSFRRGLLKGVFDFGVEKNSYFIRSEFPSSVVLDLPLKDVKLEYENGNLRGHGTTFDQSNINWILENDEENNYYVINLKADNFSSIFSYLKNINKLEYDFHLPDIVDEIHFDDLILYVPYDGMDDGEIKVRSLTFHDDLTGHFKWNEKTSQILGSLQLKKKTLPFIRESLGEIELSSLLTFAIDIDRAGKASVGWDLKTEVHDGFVKLPSLKFSNLSSVLQLSSSKKNSKGKKWGLSFKLPLKKQVSHAGKLYLSKSGEAHGLNVSGVHLQIYNGKIRLESPIVKDSNIQKANKIILTDLKLPRIFRDMGFNDITSWGEFGGVLPITLDGDNIQVKDGILQSQNSGIIKLPPYLISGLFSEGTTQSRKMRMVLNNYHYEYFEIRLDGLLNERVFITVNSRGYNPDLQDKAPVDIDFQIETQITELLKNILK